jgi:hypothetical protein
MTGKPITTVYYVSNSRPKAVMYHKIGIEADLAPT